MVGFLGGGGGERDIFGALGEEVLRSGSWVD